MVQQREGAERDEASAADGRLEALRRAGIGAECGGELEARAVAEWRRWSGSRGK